MRQVLHETDGDLLIAERVLLLKDQSASVRLQGDRGFQLVARTFAPFEVERRAMVGLPDPIREIQLAERPMRIATQVLILATEPEQEIRIEVVEPADARATAIFGLVPIDAARHEREPIGRRSW